MLEFKAWFFTTNLTLQQIKQPRLLPQRRIIDRILETCIPVCFEGEHLRKENAAANLQFYRQILAESDQMP